MILNVVTHALPVATVEVASLRETFEALDTNTSGTLSIEELTRSMQGYAEPAEVRQCGANRDGTCVSLHAVTD